MILCILSILSIYISYLKGRGEKEVMGRKVGNGRGTGEREGRVFKINLHMKKKN